MAALRFVLEQRNGDERALFVSKLGAEESREAAQVVGSAFHDVAPGCDCLGRVVEVVLQEAGQKAAHGMQTERELDDHAEIAATAAQRPEEVGVLALGREHHVPVGGHDGRSEQVVER